MRVREVRIRPHVRDGIPTGRWVVDIPPGSCPEELPVCTRRQARERLRRFQAEIENRLRANDLRAARHKLHKMLKNRAVRLQALILANRKLPKEQRRQLIDLQGLIDVIEPMSRVASPRGFAVRKSGGGSRPVFSFGLEDRACAVLIREALKPFARAHPQVACHPAQVLLSGGLPKACDASVMQRPRLK